MTGEVHSDGMTARQLAEYRRILREVVVVQTLDESERWQRACEYDGIDPRSRFVVFSDGNPYA